MAYLDVTDLNDLQVTGAINEKRKFPLGVVDIAKDSTAATSEFISPSTKAEMARVSSIRGIKFPYLKDQTPSVVTTPGFSFIPSNLPESGEYSFTAVDIFSGFRHYPAQHESNVMESEWVKKEVMNNVLYQMGKKKEELIASVFETQKTQLLGYTEEVSATSGDYAFDGTPDILKIKKAAQEETMFSSLESLMNANDLGGTYRIVTQPAGLTRQKIENAKYGTANDKNLQALEFFDNSRIYESKQLTSSVKFDGYLVRDGAIGLVSNHPYDFRAGTSFAGKQWSVSDVELPWLRSRANVYVNNEATEGTALVNAGSPADSNMKMTHFSEMAIWDRFFIVHRVNSDLSTRANDIVKVQGLTS